MAVPNSAHISPSFAREAVEHLQEGDTQRALALCLAGTTAYPDYATGHFILGKCYEACNRMTDALREYHLALHTLPDNPTLQLLVKSAEGKKRTESQKPITEADMLAENTTGKPPTDNLPDQPSTKEESTIEYLARRLQDAKRINPNSSTIPDSLPLGNERSAKIVTPTVAEIYVTQGQYSEAINAYRELAKQHPEERSRYTKRIDELEQLMTLQRKEKNEDNEQKTKAS